MLAKGGCTVTGTLTAQAAALHNVDILHEILVHCASLRGRHIPHHERHHIASLARVSKLFYIPAVKLLWAQLYSLHPLLLLLPEYEMSYRARDESTTEWIFEGVSVVISLNKTVLLTDCSA